MEEEMIRMPVSVTGRTPIQVHRLHSLPPRTEEGKALREAFRKKEPVMTDVDYGKIERQMLVNTGGEQVSILHTRAPGRKDQIKAALANAPPSFISALAQLKSARREGGNRRTRRRIEVVQKQLTRLLNKAGITLAEALEAL